MWIKRSVLMITVLVAFLGMSSDAWAMRGCGKDMGMCRGMGMNTEKHGDTEGMMISKLLCMKDELTLTQEQETKLRQLYFDSQKQIIQATAAVDQAMLDVTRLQENYELDEKQLRKAVDALYDAKRQAGQARVSQMVGVRKILTKEQFEQVMMPMSGGRLGMSCERPGMGTQCPMAGPDSMKTGAGGQAPQDAKMHHGKKQGAPAQTNK